MAGIKRTISASTENALEGLKFSVQGGPALVTLLASSSTAGETVSFSVNNTDVLVDASVNLEIADRVVDIDRDVLLSQERVPAGKYFLRAPTVAGDITYQLIIDPVG